MPDATITDGKLLLSRTVDERRKFVHALARIEGQVRGVRAMIENDRYCGDELQQIKAAISSLSRVARLLAEQHLNCAQRALLDGQGSPQEIHADLSSIFKRFLDL